MNESIISIVIRIMWTSCGIGSMAAATVINAEGLLLKILVFLCGVITVIMSIFFGSYLKHISNHSKERESLVKDKDCEDRRSMMCQKLDLILKVMKIKFELQDEDLEG